jgi:hypothetical protein
VAFDQSGPRWLGISDLIAEPEGPTFISYKVARSRLDRLRFVTQEPLADILGVPKPWVLLIICQGHGGALWFRVSAALIHCRRCFVIDYWFLFPTDFSRLRSKLYRLRRRITNPRILIAIVQQIHIGGIDEAT